MILKKVIFAALLTASLAVCPNPTPAGQMGTILVSDLRMRAGPGTNYRIVRFLPKGAKVLVLAARQGWLEIEYDKNTGYIIEQDEFIEITRSENGAKMPGKLALKESAPNAETIKGQLRQARTDLAAIARKEQEVLEAFDAADQALSNTRRQIRFAKNGLAKVDEEISAVKKRTKVLGKKISDGERYASKRLVALYKLDWVGKTQLLATADSFFDFVIRKDALNNILFQDEAQLEVLNHNKTELASFLTQLNTRKAEKQALELSLQERVAQLSAQQKSRKKLLHAIRSEKSLELAAIEALYQAALELDATIERIEPTKPDMALSTQALKKDKPFGDYKGLLSWPVKGKVTSFFGPYRDKKYAVTNFRSGINIQAERGEPIRSVLNGHVIFSNWFKGFGNMMIIDHGNHYYTVYAHLEEVFKVKGDRVDQGEVIATVGNSGSMKGPSLHFEVRHHGKPIDPLKWIKKG
jgi:septal ring factor EnvC (AmiA/AmiB activator)